LWASRHDRRRGLALDEKDFGFFAGFEHAGIAVGDTNE
jgi:hypothetical protein